MFLARRCVCMYFVRFFLRSLALCFALLCVFGAAEAAPQMIEAQGVHIMGDNDSPKAAKDMARKDAMRIAVEKAGVYVESYSKTQNMKLTTDEVRTLSGAILKVTDEKDVPELTDGVWKYTVYLTAEVDTDGIDLKTMMEHKKDIDRLQKERDALKKQNEELREKYGEAAGKERPHIDAAYNIGAVLERTVGSLQRGENDKVIAEMNRLIADTSVKDNALSYALYLRGRAYYAKKNDEKALQDFSEAIRIYDKRTEKVNQVWHVHYYRGAIYYGWRRWEDAVRDLELAWDGSGRADKEAGDLLEKAREKIREASAPTERQGSSSSGSGINWGQILTGVIIGAIQQGGKG